MFGPAPFFSSCESRRPLRLDFHTICPHQRCSFSFCMDVKLLCSCRAAEELPGSCCQARESHKHAHTAHLARQTAKNCTPKLHAKKSPHRRIAPKDQTPKKSVRASTFFRRAIRRPRKRHALVRFMAATSTPFQSDLTPTCDPCRARTANPAHAKKKSPHAKKK